MRRLIAPSVKTYAWGSRETDAAARRFAPFAPPGEPVAEVWVGDHPSGTARFADDGTPVMLPYLVKVLSVAKALSLQVHPNTEQARILHARDPINYPDTNPKPEMLVALTRFEALVGFNEMFTVDEMERLMTTCDDEPLQDTIARDYPGDPCVLVAQRLMNRVVLEPGECLVIPPGTVHAYVSGDGVEVMAKSDNVVRLGLTTKFCDARAFREIATLTRTTPDIRRGETFFEEAIGATVSTVARAGLIIDVPTSEIAWLTPDPIVSIRRS
jgi:mannose-6-phosphate isomerase